MFSALFLIIIALCGSLKVNVMDNRHNQIENADVRMLRGQRDGLKQTQSETREVIQTGDDAQQQEGRMQQHRLTHQIQAVEDQIKEMVDFLSERPASQDGTISIGHVVTIRIDGSEAKTYILVNQNGGQELSGKTTLSSGTPVGRALIGRRVGEVVSVDVGEEQIAIEIVNCTVLA
jgi:transcription elongation factor GreA